MKTLKGIFFGLALVLFTACEYEGRPYYDDFDDSILGSVFEVKGDFTTQNNFRLSYEFPKNFILYDSDVVLVYMLWEQTTNQYGKKRDVWRLMPQTIMLENGVLQYNFDYTKRDVRIFLDGTVDFTTLLPAETKDQVFRIVVLPADYAINKSIDLTDYSLLMKSLNISAGSISKTNLTVSDPVQ